MNLLWPTLYFEHFSKKRIFTYLYLRFDHEIVWFHVTSHVRACNEKKFFTFFDLIAQHKHEPLIYVRTNNIIVGKKVKTSFHYTLPREVVCTCQISLSNPKSKDVNIWREEKFLFIFPRKFDDILKIYTDDTTWLFYWHFPLYCFEKTARDWMPMDRHENKLSDFLLQTIMGYLIFSWLKIFHDSNMFQSK